MRKAQVVLILLIFVLGGVQPAARVSGADERQLYLSPPSKVGLREDKTAHDPTSPVLGQMEGAAFLKKLERAFRDGVRKQNFTIEKLVNNLAIVAKKSKFLDHFTQVSALRAQDATGADVHHVFFRLPDGGLFWLHDGPANLANPLPLGIGPTAAASKGGVRWAIYSPASPQERMALVTTPVEWALLNGTESLSAIKSWAVTTAGGKKVVEVTTKPATDTRLAMVTMASEIRAAQKSTGAEVGKQNIVLGNDGELTPWLGTRTNSSRLIGVSTGDSKEASPSLANPQATSSLINRNVSTNPIVTAPVTTQTLPSTNATLLNTVNQTSTTALVPVPPGGIAGKGPVVNTPPLRNAVPGSRGPSIPVIFGQRILGPGGPDSLTIQLLQLQQQVNRLLLEKQRLEQLRQEDLASGAGGATKASGPTDAQKLRVHDLQVHVSGLISAMKRKLSRRLDNDLADALKKLETAISTYDDATNKLYQSRGQILDRMRSGEILSTTATQSQLGQLQNALETVTASTQALAVAHSDFSHLMPGYVTMDIGPSSTLGPAAEGIVDKIALAMDRNAVMSLSARDPDRAARIQNILNANLAGADNPGIAALIQSNWRDSFITLDGESLQGLDTQTGEKTVVNFVIVRPTGDVGAHNEIRLSLQLHEAVETAAQALATQTGINAERAQYLADLYLAEKSLLPIILLAAEDSLSGQQLEAAYLQTMLTAIFLKGLSAQDVKGLIALAQEVDGQLASKGIAVAQGQHAAELKTLSDIDPLLLEEIALMTAKGREWFEKYMLSFYYGAKANDGRSIRDILQERSRRPDAAKETVLQQAVLEMLDSQTNIKALAASVLAARLDKNNPDPNMRQLAQAATRATDAKLSVKQPEEPAGDKAQVAMQALSRAGMLRVTPNLQPGGAIEIAIDLSLLADLELQKDGSYSATVRGGQRINLLALRDKLYRVIGKDLSRISDALDTVRLHILIGDKIKEEQAEAMLKDWGVRDKFGVIATDAKDLLTKVDQLRGVTLGYPADASNAGIIEINTILVLNRENVERFAAKPIRWDLENIRVNFQVYVLRVESKAALGDAIAQGLPLVNALRIGAADTQWFDPIAISL